MNSTILSLKYTRNSSFAIEDNDLSETLLNASGVDKKAFVFKYSNCTICLSDFEDGDNVKIIPDCSHTFHDKCL